LEHGNQSVLFQSALSILILATFIAVIRYVHLLLSDTLIEKIVVRLRFHLQSQLLKQSLSYHIQENQGSGRLISRILNDTTIIQNGLRYFIDLIREPITLFLLLGWLFYLNWKLTLSILIVLPLLFQILKKLSQSVSKYSRLGQQQMERVTQNIKENLDGVRVLQSFTLEVYTLDKLEKTFQEYYNLRKLSYSRIHLGGPVAEWIAMVVGVIVALSIASEIQNGQSTFGDFTSYLGALLMLNKPIKTMQDAVVRIQEVKIAASRFYEVLDTPIAVENSLKSLPFPRDFKKISFKDVSFEYQVGQPVLKNIDLEIERGQSVAFVGASGGGKSTLMNLLPRFFDVTHGRIQFDQWDVRDIDLKSLRQHIALVTQDVYLFSGSIADNIHVGNLEKSQEGLSSSIEKASARSFIEKLPKGLASAVGERGQLLSGGEKQRLSIARAIFKDAPLIIFDEATSHLDAENEGIILESMKELSQDKDKTSLIVAHRLASIIHCDQIFVFKQGHIVERGSHRSLMEQKGYYYELALSQGLDLLP
jgi:ATP-binding cassette, subfamily B, bacterial MsbA